MLGYKAKKGYAAVVSELREHSKFEIYPLTRYFKHFSFKRAYEVVPTLSAARNCCSAVQQIRSFGDCWALLRVQQSYWVEIKSASVLGGGARCWSSMATSMSCAVTMTTNKQCGNLAFTWTILLLILKLLDKVCSKGQRQWFPNTEFTLQL